MKYNNWECEFEFDPNDYKSFTYIFEFDDGHKYIGYKSFDSKDDWKEYNSSSKLLKKLINDGVGYTKKILNVYKTRELGAEEEIRLLIEHDVLKNSIWLNQNIGGHCFNTDMADDHRNKLRERKLNTTHSDTTCKKRSKSLKEYYKHHPRTPEHVDNNIKNRKQKRLLEYLIIDGKRYFSIRSASLDTNISEFKIRKMITLNEIEFKYKYEGRYLIQVDDMVFKSYTSAADFLGISDFTVSRRCDMDSYPNYNRKYIDG